jgi:hypothetical protein
MNIQTALADNVMLNFKQTVFAIENLFFDNALNRNKFDKEIQALLVFINNKKSANQKAYNTKDAQVMATYASIFEIMTDTTFVQSSGVSLFHPPFRYNFEDMFGEKDWSNMFVTKLLETHKGNCHSMPYLYKILCDELGVPCHLALSPNHIYIKHRSEKVGWYNTELTSASFPIDAWIVASGFITLEAIQNGIYMEALDDKKCLMLCVYDLAKSFDRKYPDNDGHFVIKCCDLALTHFPYFINMLMLKAETKKRQFERLSKLQNLTPSVMKQQKEGQELWADMTQLYNQIHKLGYRAMPEKMYLDWLVSLKKEQEKYSNKPITEMNKN